MMKNTVEIVFPIGTYVLSRPIKTYSGLSLRGFGAGSRLVAGDGFIGNTLISLEPTPNSPLDVPPTSYSMGKIQGLMFQSPIGSGIAAIKASPSTNVGLAQFRDLYLTTTYGLILDTYTQEVIIDNILSSDGAIEMLLHLVGNANTVKNIFKEGWGTGSSTEPYILVERADGNYFENIVIEGLTSASKSAMVIRDGGYTTIHNFWSEPSESDGYVLRITDNSTVKITGSLVGVRQNNKIQVLSSNVVFDAIIDAIRYGNHPSEFLEVDTGSQVTVWNPTPNERGDVGSKYIMLGWVNVRETPVIWVEIRTQSGK
ncbi:hypothetical protein HYW99_00585 [Candidatus Woesearchaeota archaeon]|nr:hypothetical protein [Candidatus Woesearchaeota archaeon]